MPNDHYVSRWQIKNWTPEGETRVRVYDFKSDTFSWAGPRAVFALKGLNSKEAEQRFNRLVETPLTKRRGRLLSDPSGPLDPQRIEPDVIDALWLLWSLQPNRHRIALGASLENLLEHSDEALHERCANLARSWKLVRFRVDHPYICLPSSGTFAISNSASGTGPLRVPLPDITWAIPLSPYVAFAAYPHIADVREISLKAFVTRSVGLSQHAVVVPPAFLQTMTEEQIRCALTDCRKVNRTALRGIFRARSELEVIEGQLYSELGEACEGETVD